MARTLVQEAAASHGVASRRGVWEHLFAWMFEGLVYPQIWEDPVVDMEALEIGPATRLAAIASGGCNVMSYLTAGPAEVMAVDLNRHHVALLRLKLAGARHLPGPESFRSLFGFADRAGNARLYDDWIAPSLDPVTRAYWDERRWGRRRIEVFERGFYRTGLLGRTIALGHLLARLHGRRPEALLGAGSMQEQAAIFDRQLAPVFDSWLIRLVAKMPVTWFGLGIPPAQIESMASDSGGAICALARERVRHLACDFPIRENYFAAQAFGRAYHHAGALPPYLVAGNLPRIAAAAGKVEVEQISLTRALARRPAASLNGFVLLDAQDWMTPAQLAALWAQIGRTAAPGARVIFRTAASGSPLESTLPAALLEGWIYERRRSQALHARDRSAIYGGFHLYRRTGA
jgi:S-adenosylmethionine-diacylglycerol 3-amino-3-carboxypropyl transferase